MLREKKLEPYLLFLPGNHRDSLRVIRVVAAKPEEASPLRWAPFRDTTRPSGEPHFASAADPARAGAGGL